MVFESLVVEIVNRFIGDYVENLDRSQLKIGIWGGDVVLHDLILKESVLDDLDLPVKTVYGRLGKLVLKIPWKNIYTAPVIASVENLFLVVIPSKLVVYDAEKEDKLLQEAKQLELDRIAEAKLKQSGEDVLPEVADTFTEKLATQVIRNVQVHVKDIHIRYEDKITHPGHPFALGITLHNLTVETTNEGWTPAVMQDTGTKGMIYKLLSLDGLAMYFNCGSVMMGDMDNAQKAHHMQAGIVYKGYHPKNYMYMLGPINATSHLKLNPRPEADGSNYTIPKIQLNVEMESLFIGLEKLQYQDLIRFLETLGRLTLAAQYRKYRPAATEYKGHYKEWWKFAFDCVLEEDVRRRHRNWDWHHILEHRQLCKHYAKCYHTKLNSKKVPGDVSKELEECEKTLDVLNIVLIREQIEMEVARTGRKAKEEASAKGGGGWFSGWWGGGKKEEDADAGGAAAEIAKKFEEAMTGDEKKKLYAAIGYQENVAPTTYPPTFVENTFRFMLRKLVIEVKDNANSPDPVLKVEFGGVVSQVEQRPSALALRFEAHIDHLIVSGIQQNSFIPKLIETKKSAENLALVDVLFETNPLDMKCDQRVHVSLRPLEIVYDAQTINTVVCVFEPPKAVSIDQLQEAAYSKLEEFQEMSATGLQHAIEQQTKMDLKVEVMSSYVIVPQNGIYNKKGTVLVVNLGCINMRSVMRDPGTPSVRQMAQQGSSEDEIMKEMISQSYENFLIELKDMQVLVAGAEEDWMAAIASTKTPLHLLHPTNMQISLKRCLIADDPRLPKMKVEGHLPAVSIKLTDERLFQVAGLVTSIPFPEGESASEEEPFRPRSDSIGQRKSMVGLSHLDEHLAVSKRDREVAMMQTVHLTLEFQMSELEVFVFSSNPTGPVQLLDFRVMALEIDVKQQTYNMDVHLRLGGIALNQNNNGETLNIISTPMSVGRQEYLFTVLYQAVDKKSPELHTRYGSVLQLLRANFTELNVLVQQEAMLALLKFSEDFQTQLTKILEEGETTVKVPEAVKLQAIIEEPTALQQQKPVRKSVRKKEKEVIDMKIQAHLDSIALTLASPQRNVAKMEVVGLDAGVVMKKAETQVMAVLMGLNMTDPNPTTKFKKVMSFIGNEALSANIVMYDTEQSTDPEAVDLAVQVKMACVRMVFLNQFVTNVLNFVYNFQSAMEVVMEASAAAAEAARQNMQEAYAKAVRVSLDVELKAPIIVVPECSKSTNAVILDFGILTIKNTLKTLSATNELGFPAVIDEMQLDLQKMSMSRGIINPETIAIEAGCLILQPISFGLEVKRNLSVGWYKDNPELDVSGHLASIQITLSHEDLTTMMHVLNENLAEECDSAVAVEPRKPSEEVSSRDSAQRPSTLEGLQKVQVEAVHEDPDMLLAAQGIIYTKIRFTFMMDNLVVDLFTGGSKMHESDSPKRTADDGLARFSLYILALKGKMLSDNSMVTSILLVDCLLDDTRKIRSPSGITRLMERKETVGKDATPFSTTDSVSRSMIDITYQQKNDDTFIDVRVFGFNLILCMDYMMFLAEYVTSAMSPQNTTEIKTAIAKQQEAKASAPQPPPPPPEATQPFMMTVNVRVEKPDIILVESMEDINTNALILNNEIHFKLRMTHDQQVMNGSIKDLEIYSCCYNPARRKETMAQVLAKCTISIAGSTPQGKGMHMEVFASEFKLSVSPSTIGLLTKVSSAMAATPVVTASEGKEDIDWKNLWAVKKLNESDHWFLKTEMGVDALSAITTAAPQQAVVVGEVLILSLPVIKVTLEAGVGNKTLPMIILESSLQGSVRDWSSQMFVESTLSLQMSYYNDRLALWEPLIEPIEVVKDGRLFHTHWELNAEVKMNEQIPVVSPTSDTDAESIAYVPPAMSVSVSSQNNLELTLTKTCLEVLQTVGKAFETALTEGVTGRIGPRAPYLVQNDTGMTITLLLEGGHFVLQDEVGVDEYKQVILEHGANCCLTNPPGAADQALSSSSIILEQGQVKEKYLKIKIVERNCVLQLPVTRADKRYFNLKYKPEKGDPWGLVSDVKVQDGGKIITLRSIIQVHNHFSEPIDVYYMTKRGNEVEYVGTVDPAGQINVPLKAIYTPTNELFFSVRGYSVSITPFVWKDLQKTLMMSKLLQCNPKKKEDKEPFFIKAVGELEQIYFENTRRHTMSSSCYNVHLRPTVILKNLLPVDLVICVQGLPVQKSLKAGDMMQIPTAEPGSSSIIIRMPSYLEKEWSCKHEIQATPPELAVWTFDSYDSIQKVSLDLGMHTVKAKGTIIMSLYCPFWMVNKTGCMLSYRQSDETTNVLYHPEDFEGPIMFSFRAKSFFGKKKATVKVHDSDWSDKFSLDVAGSSGSVTCKGKQLNYQIGVSIILGYTTLTKLVVFTPYYVLINQAPYDIECQEVDRPSDPWIKVAADSCAPFWPCSNKKEIVLRVAGFQQKTAPFCYHSVDTVLLKLDNKFGGINVDSQMTEQGVYVRMMSYEPGVAPALVVNHTNSAITVSERGVEDSRAYSKRLNPKETCLISWQKPTGSRVLVWDGGKNKEITNELKKDEVGEFYDAKGNKRYWISFLDGMQRVLLFTGDPAVARDAQVAGDFETIDQDITVTLHGVGLSLINNTVPAELVYLGIASSGVIWQAKKADAKRFKPLSLKECIMIEEAYQRYQRQLRVGEHPKPRVILENRMEVDFELEEVVKPQKRRLRRVFQTGLWMHVKTSPHQIQIHAKVNRLQIDNQVYNCAFPTVFAPVPPPKSVAADTVPKPFVELSIVERIMEHSPVRQFKYFKILIQEFHVKLDIGFLNGLMKMFEVEDDAESEVKTKFLEDMKKVEEDLKLQVALHSSQEQKNFYDMLHFSPLKIHISFSLSGDSEAAKTTQPASAFINVLMRSLGVTLTDMNDVVFKLAYFQRQYMFLNQRQLMEQVQMHYVGQALKQLYVLVLGLDCIGNPFGLVVGFTQGVEDLFYEPIQGAIQGPGEFVEGVVLGMRSLFGHTVGGAAGAVSKITGTLGKGIAALTFDKEYQRKREARPQRPANFQEGMAQSGKGLVKGVVEGVSGVFLKPISGAKEEGVEGFFKGVGKGVMGLATRPMAGVVDFATGSLDAVKRATELSDEVTRLRPPRFFHSDGLIRPYVKQEAEGNQLLQEVDKGKYSTTDTYVFHVILVADGKDILLITDKRIMYVMRNDIFGQWQLEWAYTWPELHSPPKATDKGILLTTGEVKKKMLGMFGSSQPGKLVLVHDATKREWLEKKLRELYTANKQ